MEVYSYWYTTINAKCQSMYRLSEVSVLGLGNHSMAVEQSMMAVNYDNMNLCESASGDFQNICVVLLWITTVASKGSRKRKRKIDSVCVRGLLTCHDDQCGDARDVDNDNGDSGKWECQLAI
jgi:hypothetical protein